MKREFIPNIDTANEEIVRLDTQLAAVPKAEDVTKLEADLKAANDALAAAPKAEDVTKLETDLKAANDALAAAPKAEDVAKLEADLKAANTKLDAGGKASLQAAAAAGVSAVTDPKVGSLGDASPLTGLTGLARAQAANAIASQGKTAR